MTQEKVKILEWRNLQKEFHCLEFVVNIFFGLNFSICWHSALLQPPPPHPSPPPLGSWWESICDPRGTLRTKPIYYLGSPIFNVSNLVGLVSLWGNIMIGANGKKMSFPYKHRIQLSENQVPLKQLTICNLFCTLHVSKNKCILKSCRSNLPLSFYLQQIVWAIKEK